MQLGQVIKDGEQFVQHLHNLLRGDHPAHICETHNIHEKDGDVLVRSSQISNLCRNLQIRVIVNLELAETAGTCMHTWHSTFILSQCLSQSTSINDALMHAVKIHT